MLGCYRAMIKIYQQGHEIPLKSFTFSGGEIQVKTGYVGIGTTINIHASLLSGNDIMELLLVTDSLRRGGAKNINLYCPYLPYARQDRLCEWGESLSLKVFCDIINSQNYQYVNIWDVHSDVSLALLNNVSNTDQSSFVRRIKNLNSDTILVSPDAGSLKKIYESSKYLDMPVIRADKTRDTKIGTITGVVVYSEPVGDRDFLIVDDICDGGRTFLELARVLRPLTTGKIRLYVTHGIFSQGLDVFEGIIDEIYCPNVFPNVAAHKLLTRI